MRQVFRVLLPVVAAAVLFLTPSSVAAQTGGISGTVRDAQGGAMPGVTVEVQSPVLIEKRSTVSDDNGRYQITGLPAGEYSVTFTLQGFNVTKRENIALSSDFTATVNSEMKVGDVKETVNVVAEAPVVDVQNARVQQVFGGEALRDLPTQRDIPSVMQLVPGITVGGLGGVCSGGVGVFCNPNAQAFNSHTSAADADGQSQGRIMVDGMVINAARNNTTTGISGGIVLDPGNAQEIAFTLSGALGESETGGASINIVPRTGGNRYSGNLFTSYTETRWFDRNRGTRLSTNAATQSYLNDYDVAGAFGGPIKRDKLWFYFNARHRGNESWPGGADIGYQNLNKGKFAANYVPDRDAGRLSYSSEYRNASLRLTAQATPKNKFNIYWDEQDFLHQPVLRTDQRGVCAGDVLHAADEAESPRPGPVDEPVHQQAAVRRRAEHRGHALRHVQAPGVHELSSEPDRLRERRHRRSRRRRHQRPAERRGGPCS